MQALGRLECVILVLTTGCNLRCSYCYQTVRRRRVMDWNTIRSAVDLLLASESEPLQLMFLGGEPLLEFATLRRTIEYAESRREARQLRYILSTNGTLLSPEIADLLDEAGVEVQLSFDGIAPAQEIRAEGTFETLDRLLVRLRAANPSLFGRKLNINLTLTPPAIPHLAESFAHLIERGCTRISITPLITSYPHSRDNLIEELDAQISQIYEACRGHYARRGRVPLSAFDLDHRSKPAESGKIAMCGAVNGTSLSVDVDGQIFGCAVIAGSVQELRSPLLLALADSMRLGALDSPDLKGDWQRFLARLKNSAPLNNKEQKYSSLGKCQDCSFLRTCTVCPASIGHIPGNADPNRVPDFACAFNKVALKYAARFRAESALEDQFNPDRIMRRMEEFVRSRSLSGGV